MARDWSGRAAALAYFEKQLKWAKQCNDDNKELIQEAVNALRRSQDHTAIQRKLNEATSVLRNVRLCADLCGACQLSIDRFMQPRPSAETQPDSGGT